MITALNEISPPDDSTHSIGNINCTQGMWYWNNPDSDGKYKIATNESKSIYQLIGEDSILVATKNWSTFTNNIVYCQRNNSETKYRHHVRLFPRGNCKHDIIIINMIYFSYIH